MGPWSEDKQLNYTDGRKTVDTIPWERWLYVHYLCAGCSSPRGPCSPPATGAESEPIAATSSGRQPSLRRAEMLRFPHQPGPRTNCRRKSSLETIYLFCSRSSFFIHIFILSPLGSEGGPSSFGGPSFLRPDEGCSRVQPPGSSPGTCLVKEVDDVVVQALMTRLRWRSEETLCIHRVPAAVEMTVAAPDSPVRRESKVNRVAVGASESTCSPPAKRERSVSVNDELLRQSASSPQVRQ